MNTDIQFDSFSLYDESQSLVREHLFVQIIVLICIIVGWGVFIQQILETPLETNLASDIEIIILWFVAGVLVPAIIIATRLEIEVTPSELRFQYKPFHVSARIIPRSSILYVQKVVYHQSAKSSGWGISYWNGAISYTVAGNEGVYIVYQNTKGTEKMIMLGSQRAAELEKLLSKIVKK